MSTWFRLDADFMAHPKIANLSWSALGLYISGLCYAAKYDTDGFLPRNLRTFATHSRPSQHAQALQECGLWQPVEGGWLIHDWLDYNMPKVQVERQKEMTRERQRRWRERSNRDALRDASETLTPIHNTNIGFTDMPSRGLDGPDEKSEDAASDQERRSAIDTARSMLNANHPKRMENGEAEL